MPIYTKKGDKGETSLLPLKEGEKRRVSKDSLRVWAIGSVDELNSFVGISQSFCENTHTSQVLTRIQKDLLNIGSILAGSNLSFGLSKVIFLERQIDKMDETLPPLTNFILPGGSVLGAHLQYCRSLTRSAERRVVALSKEEKVRSAIIKYLNRLSDYFFTIARFTNHNLGIDEDAWTKGKR